MKLLERHIEARGERRVERALADVRVAVSQRGEYVWQRRVTAPRDQLFDRAGAQVGIPFGELVPELSRARPQVGRKRLDIAGAAARVHPHRGQPLPGIWCRRVEDEHVRIAQQLANRRFDRLGGRPDGEAQPWERFRYRDADAGARRDQGEQLWQGAAAHLQAHRAAA